MQCCKFGAHSATVCYQEIMGPMGHDFGHMPIYDSPLPKSYDQATKEFTSVDGAKGQFDLLSTTLATGTCSRSCLASLTCRHQIA